MTKISTTYLYYLKYPNTPILDWYQDVNGNYVYLTEGESHTWVTGEKDSSGNTINGIDDWFLPSSGTLVQMYTNLQLEGVGGFSSNDYWSSSEVDGTDAFSYSFAGGGLVAESKSVSAYVRACRTFTAAIGAYSLRDEGPAGGLIFYIDGTTYYEAAPSDQSVSQAWSNITNSASGATGTAVGTGQANTTAIINQAGHTDSAAKLCDELISDPLLPAYTSKTVETEWKDQDKQAIAHRILRTLGVSIDQKDVAVYAQQMKSES